MNWLARFSFRPNYSIPSTSRSELDNAIDGADSACEGSQDPVTESLSTEPHGVNVRVVKGPGPGMDSPEVVR